MLRGAFEQSCLGVLCFLTFCLACIFTFCFTPVSSAAELSGYVSGQARLFTESAGYPQQSNRPQLSLAFEPEWYASSDSGDDSLLFRPFVRMDSEDNERTHVDIRELFWLHAAADWEFGAGVGKVFWGVTESQHLVDIVNQIDFVESPDGEEKLGQAMLRFSLIRDWGVLDLLWLPHFRPRTFSGSGGRLRTPFDIDTERELYESSAEEWHQDFALRWSHSLGLWDVGLSWFEGTSREPTFVAGLNGRLVPYYAQISHAGVDVQATTGSWLLKLEAIHQKSRAYEYTAATGGFEYTFVGLFDSDFDLGLLMEYSWDSREENSTTGLQNDFFLGGRLTLNDEDSTELLFGLVQDFDYSASRAAFVEASRRFGDGIRLYVEARLFDSDTRADPLFAIRDDSFLEITLEYYF